MTESAKIRELKFTKNEEECLKAASILLKSTTSKIMEVSAEDWAQSLIPRSQGYNLLLDAVKEKYKDCVRNSHD